MDLVILSVGFFTTKVKLKFRRKDVDRVKWFYIISFLVLFFVSAFRGDFSTDYRGYEDIYQRFSRYNFVDLLQRPLFLENPETGYLLFQQAIRVIFDNVLFIFIITSAITVFCNIYTLKKISVMPLLGVFLYMHFGEYHSGFNLIRQALAVAITMLGTKYLFDRKMIKYFLIILLAGTIHTSVFIMIPFYFVATVRINRKNFLFYPAVIIVLLYLQNYFFGVVTKYLWGWYNTGSGTGYNWKNLVVPLFVSLTALFLFYFDYSKGNATVNKINRIGREEAILLNSTVIFILFTLAGLFFTYAQRLSMSFSLYTIGFVCLQVRNSRYRNILSFGMILALFMFSIVAGWNDTPYYFIWNR